MAVVEKMSHEHLLNSLGGMLICGNGYVMMLV